MPAVWGRTGAGRMADGSRTERVLLRVLILKPAPGPTPLLVLSDCQNLRFLQPIPPLLCGGGPLLGLLLVVAGCRLLLVLQCLPDDSGVVGFLLTQCAGGPLCRGLGLAAMMQGWGPGALRDGAQELVHVHVFLPVTGGNISVYSHKIWITKLWSQVPKSAQIVQKQPNKLK